MTIFIGYVSSALALAIPFLNTIGAKITNIVQYADLKFSYGALIMLGVWALSGTLASHDRHENALVCALNSLGLPGLLLAGMTALSQLTK